MAVAWPCALAALRESGNLAQAQGGTQKEIPNQMNLRNSLIALTLLALPALAGPPLICHRIEIGDAKSLPWNAEAQGWNGAVLSYDVSANLLKDTLAILAPGTAIPVRMETMRRSAIYAARDARLASGLAAKLEARAAESGAAVAWFDAGYWIESVRQASFIYRYDMLSPSEKDTWQIRKGLAGRDGHPMVKKAISLGGAPGMDRALALIEEYRNAGDRLDKKKSGS